MIRFRQIGILVIVLLGVFEATMCLIGILVGEWILVIIALGVFSPLALLFHALTIEVGVDRVRCFYGPGLISRSVSLDRIRAVRAVRTSIVDGWGIRLVRGGWLWNVSGFDAVELQLDSGRVFQMGTDRPAEVIEAINAVIAAGADEAASTGG